MTENAPPKRGVRRRFTPLRVPVDAVARHSAAPIALDALVAASAASSTVPKASRGSVVAIKSVIVTGMVSRKLSQPPSTAPIGGRESIPPMDPRPPEPDSSLAAAATTARSANMAAHAPQPADIDVAVEISTPTEPPPPGYAETAAETWMRPSIGVEDDSAPEITVQHGSEATGEDDVLDMEDLEEVAPAKKVDVKTTPAVPAAPAAPATPAAPPAASAAVTAPATPPAAPIAPSVPHPHLGPAKRKPWFEDFFSDDYLRTVRAPTPKEVARECDAIMAMLKLERGAIILDVGCGLGMHAIELTMRGYIVIGLDLSLPMLSRAADEAQDHGIRINFLHADMREMAFEGGFDAVLCWGTTFGYFDDEGNRAVVERFYSALKPGGRLLIDVVNRDHVIQSQPNLVWFEGDGCICMEETEFNYFTSRLNVKRNVILDTGRQHDRHYSIRLYALHELGALLQSQGFRTVEVTGRYATPGVFFGAESPRMIVLAERRLTARDTPSPSSPPPPPPPTVSPASRGDGGKPEPVKGRTPSDAAPKPDDGSRGDSSPPANEGDGEPNAS